MYIEGIAYHCLKSKEPEDCSDKRRSINFREKAPMDQRATDKVGEKVREALNSL